MNSGRGATNYKYTKLPGEAHHRSSYSPPKIETSYYSNVTPKLDESYKTRTISDNGNVERMKEAEKRIQSLFGLSESLAKG